MYFTLDPFLRWHYTYRKCPCVTASNSFPFFLYWVVTTTLTLVFLISIIYHSFNKYFSSDSCGPGRLLYVGEFIQCWTAMGWTTCKKTPANCTERPDNFTWRSTALNFHIKYVRSIIFVSLNIYTSKSGQWGLFLNITKHIFFLWGKICITLTIPQFF